jgi:DNA-binding GntR family transcriptional regulator
MTDAQILVLLAARLRSRGGSAALEAAFVELGGDRPAFPALLDEAERLEQIRSRGEEGRRSLTDAGEAELAAYLAAESVRVGRADLMTAYEAFLPLNREFLAALASEAGLAHLAMLVDRLDPVLHALAAQLGRFGGYRTRFDHAFRQAETDPVWVAGPSVDSIHTIWFELHEHLLATLGRNRSEER